MGSDAAIKVLENSASLVVSMSGTFHGFVKYFLAAGLKFRVMPSCIVSSSAVFWSMIPSKWVNALFCVLWRSDKAFHAGVFGNFLNFPSLR
jgi:hypothetical protein